MEKDGSVGPGADLSVEELHTLCAGEKSLFNRQTLCLMMQAGFYRTARTQGDRENHHPTQQCRFSGRNGRSSTG
jgi:hypothetical protein